MTIAQVTILVQRLQWLNGILIDLLDVAQNNLSNVVGGLLPCIELLVQQQQLGDMLTAATILWNDTLLVIEDIA